MASLPSTEQLARASARRPWLVVGLWLALLVVGGLLALNVGDVLTTEQESTEELEAARALRLVEERLGKTDPARELVIVQSERLTVDDPQFEAFVSGLLANVRKLDVVAVEGTTSYYETGVEGLVSADRRKTLVIATLRGEEEDAEANVVPLVELVEGTNGRQGFEVLTAGEGSIDRAFIETAEKDLQTAEFIGLPIALVVLLVVFGAAVAAGLPVVLALLSIVVAVGATTVVGQTFQLSVFVINMITMIGLAVGIDYSLFVVQRFREERRRGRSKVEAIATAGATASRAVLFSGLTVIVALLGLLIVPDTTFRSLGAGAILVVIFAVLAALTLLPAALSLLGDRVNALRLPLRRSQRSPDDEGGFWGRSAALVMRAPVLSVVVSVALLVAAAAPYFTIDLGFPGVSTLPRSIDTFRAFGILDREFSAGLIEPAQIVVDAPDVTTPEVQGGIDRLMALLGRDEAFGPANLEANEASDLAVISVPVVGDPHENQALDAIDRLRDEYIPSAFADVEAEALVTGDTAFTADYGDLIASYTPIVFAFVLGISFLLLLVMFRSIVVPIKAIVMNLLSVGAAYGLLVLVFQHGVASGLLGFQRVDRIAAWVPLLLFAILFGLSMDYHVFLLSRIRERFGQTGDNAASVGFGIRSTAGIITGAALIMVAVFAAFAMGDLVMFQQMGFGLAVAVTLDATIIRSVLVPASMVLLGDLNWYLPRWLRWLPEFRFEGARPPSVKALSGVRTE